MKSRLLVFCLLVSCLLVSRSAIAATGCGYPTTLDTFPNVSTGQILTAADYNKIQCAVEKLEASLSIPDFTSATKPASAVIGQIIYVTDASTNATCTAGGGSVKNLCIWDGAAGGVPGGGGGGGPTAFSDITPGTNTSGALVIGSGASLATSGSGTIAATTTVAFASNGSNTSGSQFARGVDTFGNAEPGDVAKSGAAVPTA